LEVDSAVKMQESCSFQAEGPSVIFSLCNDQALPCEGRKGTQVDTSK